jgi:hypothetical protein
MQESRSSAYSTDSGLAPRVVNLAAPRAIRLQLRGRRVFMRKNRKAYDELDHRHMRSVESGVLLAAGAKATA